MRLPDDDVVDAAMDAFHDHSWRGQKPVIYEVQMPELLAVLRPVIEKWITPRRSRVPNRKPAKVDKGREGATRDVVRKRSGGWCERCGGARADSMHHRRFRSQGGPWTPSNILHLCGDGTTGCHGLLTNTNGHRGFFEAMGWIVPSHADWSETPVMRRGRFVMLDDLGGVSAVEGETQNG